MLIMMLTIMALMLIDPTTPVAETGRSQLQATCGQILGTVAIVNGIASTEFTKERVRPFVDAVISGQRLVRVVLVDFLLALPSGRVRSRCRNRASFHSVASATGKDNRFVAIAFLVVQHLAAALALLRRRQRRRRMLLLIRTSRCRWIRTGRSIQIVLAQTQRSGQCFG